MSLRYDLVLFDADGTLFDFDRAEAMAFAHTMAARGYPSDDQAFAQYRTINEGLWRALELGQITPERLKATRFGLWLEAMGLTGESEPLNRAYLDALAEGWYLLPGAETLCQTLAAACPLYLATNGIGYVQRRRLEASPLRPYITDVFISEELGASKPDPLYFDRLLARIPRCPPRARILLVGDSLSSDMRGGRLAGLTTCWFNPGGRPCPEPALCDITVRTLEEVIPLVLPRG